MVLWEAELREDDAAALLREDDAAELLREDDAAAELRVVLCEEELRVALEDEPRLWAPSGAAARPAARMAVIARVKNVFIMPLVLVIRINNTWRKAV